MSTATEAQRTMHGNKLSDAIKEGHVDAVPGDDKAHAHSHAAHLNESGKVHMSPEGIGKQGRESGSLNQPPQDPTRNGKAHARQ